MIDTAKLNNIQDCAAETRTIINLLIKLVECDDKAPAYFSDIVNLLDEKHKKLEQNIMTVG